jgi:hypothetical protein
MLDTTPSTFATRLSAPRSGERRAVPIRRLVVTALVIAATGCVNHPVGPARTVAKFEGKAATTASSALSAVETVRLLARTAADGKAFGPFTSVAVSEQEDTLGGLRGTFLSIQPPPGDDVEALRDELSTVLTSAFDHVGAVRIEVRRGNLDELDVVAGPLQQDADDLRALVEELE